MTTHASDHQSECHAVAKSLVQKCYMDALDYDESTNGGKQCLWCSKTLFIFKTRKGFYLRHGPKDPTALALAGVLHKSYISALMVDLVIMIIILLHMIAFTLFHPQTMPSWSPCLMLRTAGLFTSY